MKKQYVLLTLAILMAQFTFSQFTLDGEFRPRTEYRNGFGSLITDAADPGLATSTRARLNAGYQTEKYKFYLSLQDVMVWGENRQLRPDDENDTFAVFEAWAELNLGSGWSTKLGRQILSYDDQRILGGVDWTQQARNHDAALVKYSNGGFMLDFAFAFNQDFDNPTGFQSVGNAYNTTGFFSYKTMQMLYLKQKWESFAASLVLLNNGFQNFDGNDNADGLSSLQTLGTHLTYKKGSFGLAANAFIQTGERQGGLDVKGAYLLGLDLSYKASSTVGLGAGIEIISGNDGQTAGETSAFFPLYGTNHKFNGLMDYFYVGNHANSVGIFDIHASANFKLGENSDLLAKVWNFKGEQDLPSGENALGTEVDLVFTQKFKGYALKIGYSHLFPADGMYELKGVPEADAASTQNWAWAMLIIKPKLFTTAKAE
ncbi:alginate export family protein [Muricauda sp. CAU 1633]|uniref:alginate export family protein n=1 Tax=Allomuricauda sp. CAU 1633 TaxID=2816036 RepID=UPI001A8E892F|nr:alginate export family protein [Muricauda sp. CAU 1633]MBO0323740.1 alginate export family protein [Muricauda sp. CAU 1633]